MADLSFVQVAADSTGKRLRTTTVADGGSTMHQEIMVVAGGTGKAADGALGPSDDPATHGGNFSNTQHFHVTLLVKTPVPRGSV